MFTNLENLLNKYLELGIPGFDCVVFQNGKQVYRCIKGFSNLASHIPMQGKERFNLYSCSKLITVTAALQLYDKKLFSMDDDVSLYLPQFRYLSVRDDNGVIRPAVSPLRIRHLFNMTAGFNYDTNMPIFDEVRQNTDGRCPTQETINALARVPLLFDPGTRFEYSFCHDVLAALVEQISKMRFSAYVKKHIFDQVGMMHSTFAPTKEDVSSLMEQYIFCDGELWNCGKNIQYYKFGTEYESGGAGCISSTEDYIMFLEALRCNTLISSHLVDLMSTNTLTSTQQEAFFLNDCGYGYGLGVRCPKETTNNKTSDFGWGGAAGSYAVIDRKNKLTVFYAQHAIDAPNSEMKREIIRCVHRDLSIQ